MVDTGFRWREPEEVHPLQIVNMQVTFKVVRNKKLTSWLSCFPVLAPHPPPSPPLKWLQLLKVDCRPTCKAFIENAVRWRRTTTTMDPKKSVKNSHNHGSSKNISVREKLCVGWRWWRPLGASTTPWSRCLAPRWTSDDNLMTSSSSSSSPVHDVQFFQYIFARNQTSSDLS